MRACNVQAMIPQNRLLGHTAHSFTKTTHMATCAHGTNTSKSRKYTHFHEFILKKYISCIKQLDCDWYIHLCRSFPMGRSSAATSPFGSRALVRVALISSPPAPSPFQSLSASYPSHDIPYTVYDIVLAGRSSCSSRIACARDRSSEPLRMWEFKARWRAATFELYQV